MKIVAATLHAIGQAGAHAASCPLRLADRHFAVGLPNPAERSSIPAIRLVGGINALFDTLASGPAVRQVVIP